MNLSTLWRAALLQALAVAPLFALLVAVPLPPGFFREQGALVGPAAWLVCSLVVASILRLGVPNALAVAVGSGLLAVAAGALLGHSAGMVAGVLGFGALCGRITRSRGGRGARRQVASHRSARDPA